MQYDCNTKKKSPQVHDFKQSLKAHYLNDNLYLKKMYIL